MDVMDLIISEHSMSYDDYLNLPIVLIPIIANRIVRRKALDQEFQVKLHGGKLKKSIIPKKAFLEKEEIKDVPRNNQALNDFILSDFKKKNNGR